MLTALTTLSPRRILYQTLNFLLILSSAMMLWKGLGVLTNTESPIVVVLSESMEPSFKRGDLLFLVSPPSPIHIGDICVFKLAGKEIPIVHRAIEVHNPVNSSRQYILTKGDNNPVDDRGLYNKGQMWVREKDIIGRVKGYGIYYASMTNSHLPYIGMITIILNDYPQLKIGLLACLGLFVLISRDE